MADGHFVRLEVEMIGFLERLHFFCNANTEEVCIVTKDYCNKEVNESKNYVCECFQYCIVSEHLKV